MQRHYAIQDYGVPVAIWKEIQSCKNYFFHLRASEQAFLFLPSTRFSLVPQSHSTSYHDTHALVTAMTSRQHLPAS